MAVREGSKTKLKVPEIPEPEQDQFSQRKREAEHRYRLQVDRLTKSSYTTAEAAEKVGRALKKKFPVIQVAIYDGVDGVRTLIEAAKD